MTEDCILPPQEPSEEAIKVALEAWYTTPWDRTVDTQQEADTRCMAAALTAAMRTQT